MQIVLSPEDLANFFRNVFNTENVSVRLSKSSILLDGIAIDTLHKYVTNSSPKTVVPPLQIPEDDETLDTLLNTNAALANTKTRLPKLNRPLGSNEFLDPPEVSEDELRSSHRGGL
jgi:hypothetical protein